MVTNNEIRAVGGVARKEDWTNPYVSKSCVQDLHHAGGAASQLPQQGGVGPLGHTTERQGGVGQDFGPALPPLLLPHQAPSDGGGQGQPPLGQDRGVRE